MSATALSVEEEMLDDASAIAEQSGLLDDVEEDALFNELFGDLRDEVGTSIESSGMHPGDA